MTVASMLLDDRYLLDEEIGAGGFCAVWRATDSVLTRPVAVKLLHAVHAHQPESQARFKAEARHAGALSHENIARVYDYGEPERGRSYLVMELIEGPSLATVLAGGPLDATRTMDVVAQVAAGLQAAHSAGLIHRDIKPSNIMFTPEGTVRITDFGIAHSVGSAPLTATGLMMGSPGYIAPERVDGARGGPASDLYALGIVAYECLTGSQPFPGTPLEVAIAHRDRPLPPLPPWVPAEVADLVMILTAKDPAWRPASAGEVACQARRLRDDLVAGTVRARPVPAATPVTGNPGGEGRPARPSPVPAGRSRRSLPLIAAIAALAGLACLAVFTITALASTAAHHAARSAKAAPSATATAPTASPAAAQQHPATPSASTRALAAGGHAPGRPPVLQPGPPGLQPGPPGHHKGPGQGDGHGKGQGQGEGNGSGKGQGDGEGD
jgi:serine/threonine-protein kinase